MSSDQSIIGQLRESANVTLMIGARQVAIIRHMADTIIAAYRTGKKVVTCGNGGSAAEAQHIAAELVGRLQLPDRPPLAAVALTTDSSVLTAVGNDFGFEQVFARQVEACVHKGDVVIALSTSGNSPNVLAAVEKAKSLGATTIGLTGTPGGALADAVDLVLAVPSESTQRIQEAHLTVGHIVCSIVESELFGVRRHERVGPARRR
ncbi:MAG TPA: D-sedoheptulose 7-phosphate isomerase [bacterium]|nr:D-sedoheptulose 7-phosphate isomerase [bacterium]